MRTMIVAAAVACVAAAPATGQRQVRPDVLRKAPPIPVKPYDSDKNRALMFGWTGAADTNVPFSAFFDGDHTLMAWFMPQYTRAYVGPIFGNTGSGTYVAGHGSFYQGTASHSDDGKGQPVLYIKAGTAAAVYLAPAYTAGKWHHIAVVRKGNTLSLYLDGVQLTPVKISSAKKASPAPEITLPATLAAKPAGMLRFGRTGALDDAQAYGMIDDAAVFTRALGAADIAQYRTQRRFFGNEPHLLATWNFDEPAQASGAVMPSGRTFKVPVKGTQADGAAVSNLLFLGSSEAVAPRLPFPKNEAWRVVQGSDSPAPSHHDRSAFSYDFVRAKGSSVGATLVASAAGRVSIYKPVPRNGEGNVTIEVADGLHITYGHLGSLNAKVTGGTRLMIDGKERFVFDKGKGPFIAAGEAVGTVGPYEKHLHTGGNPGPGSRLTTPLAYFDYEVSADQGKTWKSVIKGMPGKGQWIRRVK